MANAPTSGKTELEIFRAGTTKDGRHVKNSNIKELYHNTKTFLLKKGILIPVTIGHSDNTEDLKGKVLNVSLRKINGAPSLHYGKLIPPVRKVKPGVEFKVKVKRGTEELELTMTQPGDVKK